MNTEYIAPYFINRYVWELIKRNTDISDEDYNIDGVGRGLTPIVPLGEEKELEAFDKPYIVYGYSENPASRASIPTTGYLVYVIFSTNFQELSGIANLIAKVFEDDRSVDNVNHFTSTLGAPFAGMRFGDIEFASIDGGEPEEESGGRMNVSVTLRYSYYGTYEIETSFANWNGSSYEAN